MSKTKILLLIISAVPSLIFCGYAFIATFNFVFFGATTDTNRLFAAIIVGIILFLIVLPASLYESDS